ncbi:MAG: DUF2281 domain-containing protein [Elusimicrobia bacterium]|nr:DUF2281 domain-containing protein [Elusimicrobiota bacterium]
MQQNLEEKIKKLPPELYKEISDFIDFLLSRRTQKSRKKKKPTLNWFGGLEEYRKNFTSLELQKKALEWRD